MKSYGGTTLSYNTIIYEVDDKILTITLNRPEKLNAFTGEMQTEFIDALDRSDADDNIRAVIVTGAGRAFCAGADLSAGANTFKSRDRETGETAVPRDGGGVLTLRIFDSKKPIIAAVNGPAVGVGVTMQLAMDIRLASTSAKFGFVFARRGIVPEACSSYFLPRVVGISQALEWCYSGRVFPAAEAYRGGLVREPVAPDALMTSARALANEIALNTSPVSVTLVRQMMWRMLGADHPMEAHKIDSRGIYHRGKSADAREGVESFLEKRPAEYPETVSRDLPPYYPWWDDREFS